MPMSNSSVLTPSSSDFAKARSDSSVVSPLPPRWATRSKSAACALAAAGGPHSATTTARRNAPSRACMAAKLSAALAGDFGEYHSGSHRRIQRFGGAGHRDGLHRVAGLPHQPGQALAFRAHDDHQRIGAVQLIDGRSSASVQPDYL